MVPDAGLTLGFIAVVGGLWLGTIATVFRFRHERHKLEHAERMRSFELGRPLPQNEPWWSPLRIAVVIGGAVPLGAFLSACVATSLVGFHDGMWIAASTVGMVSVIAGATVAGTSHNRRPVSDQPEVTKPYVDEDAYDVVSSRG
jgi:hypothetical protein